MRKIKKLSPLLLLTFFFLSCATSNITNLTPTQQPRNATGLYPIEMLLDSSQQTLRPQSITPLVVVGFENYPMRPTLKMTNRWEALVPVPPDKDSITYHFKVNYEYNRFGKPGQGSLLSPEYNLTVTGQ